MNNVLSSVQMLETSEKCDKYSKSVSYETLVIGATTTGREIKQKESSLILRKAKFQAIFKFVLSSASGGAGGRKYNRISAFVSMPVLLIRSSLEKFFKKNFRDDSSFCFGFAKVKVLSFLRLRGASGAQGISATASCRKAHKRRFLFNLIRSSLEFFRVPRKNMDDSSFCFGFAEVKALSFLRLRGASGAQGISAPASCRKAHKRRFLLNQLVFRFVCTPLRMTIPMLALLFTLTTTTESWADESATQTQETPKILPDSGSCGNGCLYQITTDSTTGTRNLRVYNDPNYTGVAKIASYAFAGKGNDTTGKYQEYYANASFDKITIDGDFDTIGHLAFWRNGASEVVFNGNIKTIDYKAFEFNNLTSVNLPEGLQKIGGEAFHVNSISSIVIPDSVTSIGSYAFGGLKSGGEVYISDSLNNLGTYYPFGLGQRPDIFCKGDELKCQNLVKEYHLDNSSTTTDLSDRVTGVDKDHCTGEKYFWNGTSCSRKESYCDKNMYYSGYECKMRPTDGTEITCDYDISGYVKVGNNCYSPEVTYAKKHYTPAEANQWLHDGNDNFVVLTFKK